MSFQVVVHRKGTVTARPVSRTGVRSSRDFYSQSDLDNCLDACASDPSCEAECYSTFDQCNSFAADDYNACVDDANLDRQSCVDFANETNESCLAACEPVPLAERSFSTLKHRYE